MCGIMGNEEAQVRTFSGMFFVAAVGFSSNAVQGVLFSVLKFLSMAYKAFPLISGYTSNKGHPSHSSKKCASSRVSSLSVLLKDNK
jgi:hypothetical protein